MNLILWLTLIVLVYTAVFCLLARLFRKKRPYSAKNSTNPVSKDIQSEDGFEYQYDEVSNEAMEAAKQKLIASFRSIQEMQNQKIQTQTSRRYQNLRHLPDEPKDPMPSTATPQQTTLQPASNSSPITDDAQQPDDVSPLDVLAENKAFIKSLNLKIKEQ